MNVSLKIGLRPGATIIAALVCALVMASGSIIGAWAETPTQAPPATGSETPDAAPPSSDDAEPPVAKPDEATPPANLVCCDDGTRRDLRPQAACEKASGQILPRRYCEKPKAPVCCKQGRTEWWMPDAESCHADGGVVANKSYCR